jgi:hypothetical protein
MTNTARTGIVLVMFAQGLAGCGEAHPPTAPSQSSVPQQSPQPNPQPTPIQPVVTSVAPIAGSTGGDAWGTITGTDFQPGAAVRLGDGPAKTVWVQDSTTILFWTSAHAAGTVDVVVTNPGGLVSRLAAAYTYASPESFDFNGEWVAHAGPEFDTEMRFAVRDDLLVSLSCGTTTLTLSAPVHVRAGEFSFVDDDGFAVSGRLVSPVNAVGTINVPGCSAAWWADKSGGIRSAGAR